MEGLESAERTPLVIAAEINAITLQTKKIILASAIEVGRRLTEVKIQLPHGEWLQWLEESVGYSARKATNLIRIYEAYGAKTEEISNQHACADLSYSHALILLGVPDAERDQFIIDMDIESMSTRQLEKAVQERKEAVEEYNRVLAEEENLKKMP